MIPQIIYLIFLGMAIGGGIYRHDKPRTGNHNFTHDLIAIVIQILIMYFGGFFDVFFK